MGTPPATLQAGPFIASFTPWGKGLKVLRGLNKVRKLGKARKARGFVAQKIQRYGDDSTHPRLDRLYSGIERAAKRKLTDAEEQIVMDAFAAMAWSLIGTAISKNFSFGAYLNDISSAISLRNIGGITR